MSDILAPKGTAVSCPNDHRLYRLTADIRAGTTVRADQFVVIDARLPAPRPYDPMPRCPECGEAWIKFRPYASIHLEGLGWTGTNDDELRSAAE